MRKKTYRLCNLRKWKDFNKKKKNSLPYLKCVFRLSCVVHGPIYGRFMSFYVNGFLSLKVYQGWALQRSGSTDPPKENGRKFAPTAPIASKFRLGNTR